MSRAGMKRGAHGPAPVRVGDDVELEIVSLAFGGAGVARIGSFAVFVKGGLPGQTVRARITKRKSGHAEARVLEVLIHSADEVPPPCIHFGPCGGCLWQHLDYAKQLEAKADQVRASLIRIGGIADPPMNEPLAAPEPYRYRNKMEFSFADSVWIEAAPDENPTTAVAGSDFGCGLHARGRFDKVVNHVECHLMAPWAVEALIAARNAARATGLPPYSPRRNSGFFRYLVLREGVNTGEKMVNLITYPTRPGSFEETAAREVLAAVRGARPDVTSLVHGGTASLASVAFCESWHAVAGPPLIHERLLDDVFEVGPNTFFQTNTHQAERLFETALALAVEKGGDGRELRPALVWDLYCGVGAFTLPLSRHAERVVGVEIVESSVQAARSNAERNGRENVTFLAADMKKALTPEGLTAPDGALLSRRPDLLVVDPPRDGMHPDVVKALVALAAPRLVYISCNPATLARDAKLLVQGGYGLDTVVPVDMFPQTAHVEVVARFQRANSS
jgi:23S rRNA (uracil1939-C5)-methyltransferase